MPEEFPSISDRVAAEWIILADHVEVITNKLYLMGGGWDTVSVPTVPHELRFALAVALMVPWNETNRVHNIEIEILDQDGTSLVKVEGQTEVGRPPGIPAGHTQRVQIGVSVGMKIQNLRTYVVVVRVQGHESKRTTFNVVPALHFQHQQQQ